MNYECDFTIKMYDNEVDKKSRQVVLLNCCAVFHVDINEGYPEPVVDHFLVETGGIEVKVWEKAEGLLHDLVEEAFVYDATYMMDCAEEQGYGGY